MKNTFTRICLLAMLVLVSLCSVSTVSGQTTITLGTGTTSLTSPPIPFYNYYTNHRTQYLILASELNGLGLSGTTIFSSLGFQISSLSTSQSGSCPGGSLYDNEVKKLVIKCKNTSENPLSGTFDNGTDFTEVYNVASYLFVSGWNTHYFTTNFSWDGSSNVLVDICFDNSQGSYCYSNGATLTFLYAPTSVKGAPIVTRYIYSDVTNGSNCTASSGTATSDRPNMQLSTALAASPTPPLPGFAFNLGEDTLWENSPSLILNTSTNSVKNYWNITGYNGNSATGTFGPVTVPPQDQCNAWGCFIDTLVNPINLSYSFPKRGYYNVKLTTVNLFGTNYIEKTVFVDTPARKPTSSFFATKRVLGVNDRTQFNNLSKNAPARNKWYLVNTCQSCGAGNNQFLPTDSSFNPSLLALTPGSYKVCLAVSNSKGSDTLCREGYITIKPGFMMCHTETGSFDSVSKDDEGYIFSNIKDNITQTSLSGSYIPTSCTGLFGFRIAPCADTINVYLERLRLRSGDSLYIRSVAFNGPILRRFGGTNNTINILKDTVKTLKYAGQQLFITYVPAAGAPSVILDSGFALHWTSTAAKYAKPKAAFICADTLYSGYRVKLINSSVGNNLDYGWDLNGDGNFGGDNKSVIADSVTQNPTMIYTTLTTKTIKICLRTANCKGTDTACKTVTLMPTINPPSADFTVTPSLGFILDTFMFVDKSRNGPQKWRWQFDPNNVTYLSETDSSSQFPLVYLNSPQCYNVTLISTNPYGSDQTTKNMVACAIDYGSPGSSFAPSSSSYDFGIRRVRIEGADGTVADTLTAPKPIPTGGNNGSYTRNFQTKGVTVYRGGTYVMDVYRGSAVDSVNTRVWADYNRDADYTDGNETIYSQNAELLLKTHIQFTVPAEATIGQSRIMVGMSWYKSLISPVTATLGVYEDFGMKVGGDNVKPVVKLNGKAIVRAELNKPYIDAWATATDNIQANISDSIKMIGSVDITHYGYYELKYYVMDYYGNVSDTVTRSVQIEVNQSGPTLELQGSDTIHVEVYGTYNEPGYSAQDHLGNVITGKVVVTSDLNTSALGYYLVTYKITDDFGLSEEQTRVIKVEDTTIPVVVVKEGKGKVSPDTVQHQIFTAFEDKNYLQVNDNYWDDVTLVRTGTINTEIRGIYSLTYNAVDGSGNKALTKTVFVIVTNLVKPTIVLKGAPEMIVPVYGPFDDPGASGYDFSGKKLDPIRELNDLNINIVGDYMISYNIYEDGFGNSARVTRRIKVRDLEAPVISLNGDNPFTIPYGANFALLDPGVKKSDNYDEQDEIKVAVNYDAIDPLVSKMYSITYVATDSSGNVSTPVKRYVAVGATGLENLAYSNMFSLYPNPASRLLNIEMKESSRISELKVYDIQGKDKGDLHLQKGISGNYTIDVSTLSSGLYLLKVETEDGKSSSARFIVGK